jgi:hypothetical protein
VNALLLETAQAMDEVSVPGQPSEGDMAEQEIHRNRVWRLAALSRSGAEFVVAQLRGRDGAAEGWGTESTAELARLMQQMHTACEDVGELLQAGPLNLAEAHGPTQRLVLLPQEKRTFLLGWTSESDPGDVAEQAKQLVASWDF